jgi:diadenosine tetraphosphate (Ap4A) HIT family hydrolase
MQTSTMDRAPVTAIHLTAIHRRVLALQRAEDPTLIARLPSGWAVFGEQQFLRGYSLLLPDPVVGHLNDFAVDTAGFSAAREQFLVDMARLGEALLQATGALRINYAMFGNVEPALHAHLIPRYTDETPALATAHPWAYDWQAAPRFDAAALAPLREDIRRRLQLDQSVGA